MQLSVIRAKIDTDGVDISGENVVMAAGTTHIVRTRDLQYYEQHSDAFEIVSATPGLLLTDANGNVVGLDPSTGSYPNAGVMGEEVDIRDWNGLDLTGNNDVASLLSAAVTQLETAGAGKLIIPTGHIVCDSSVTVRGGDPTLNGGYQGGIEICGRHMVGTKIEFTAGSGFIVDCGPAPTHGSNSAMAMIGFRDIHLVGPGSGTSGSVGIDVSPQGNYQSTPNAVRFMNVWLDGWENPARFDDTTNLWVLWCYFTNYIKGLRFGYNHDSMTLMFNRFGENQTEIGSQVETALAWDFISPRFTGATTLSGAQNHKITNNWFLRQALVADIWDTSASNITFEHNQFESCTHYAQFGNSGSTSAPGRVIFQQNTFMRVDGQEETQAKFRFMNDAAGGSLRLTKNTCDTATGPKQGWVRCGTGSVVEFDDNTLPTAGAYVVEANHLVVGASGKKITLGAGEKYTFRTVTGAREVAQWNASGNDGTPYRECMAYNATNGTIHQRWGARGATSETVSGTPFDIQQRTINGTRYALSVGGNIPLQGSALPSLGSDGNQWRGVRFLVQGGAGVADAVYECRKNAADAYAWVAVT